VSSAAIALATETMRMERGIRASFLGYGR